MADFIESIRNAGVIGAGGAGFPTHVKVNCKGKAEYIIANGAECEPLLRVDQQVMALHARAKTNLLKPNMTLLKIRKHLF